jgi:rhodanese-related sulfurtransferase
MTSKSSGKSSGKATPKVISLTPHQLKSRQDRMVVVDVRGWFEYWMGHIPGAKSMSVNQIINTISPEEPVVLTCLSGHRSAMAAQILTRQGYQKVYNLQGGVMAWQGAGYDIKRGNKV